MLSYPGTTVSARTIVRDHPFPTCCSGVIRWQTLGLVTSPSDGPGKAPLSLQLSQPGAALGLLGTRKTGHDPPANSQHTLPESGPFPRDIGASEINPFLLTGHVSCPDLTPSGSHHVAWCFTVPQQMQFFPCYAVMVWQIPCV